MSARVLEFPQAPFAARQALCRALETSSLRSPGSHASLPGAFAGASTQTQANRIVAQVEREISAQAYAQVQQRYLELATPAKVCAFETPASMASRILQAVRSFAYSA